MQSKNFLVAGHRFGLLFLYALAIRWSDLHRLRARDGTRADFLSENLRPKTLPEEISSG